MVPNEFDFNDTGTATGVANEYGERVLDSKRDPSRKAGTQFKNVLKSLIKHIGLALIIISYIIGGGYLFRTLELENEYSVCAQRQNGFLEKLNASTSRVIGLVKAQNDPKLAENLVRNALINLANELFILDFQPDMDCSAIRHTANGAKWNLANSMYFCATIITTIGYGHIAPSTFWGRISCIVYAAIGMPIMLIYLAIIGNMLAKAFRTIYVNLICCRCFYDVFRRRRQKRLERLAKWEEALRQHEEDEARRRGLPVPPRRVQAAVVDDETDLDEDNRNEGETIAVPLTVSLIVLASYTAIGAALFPIWEDWSYADAAYFSFITISTIGLGDLVIGAGRLHESGTSIELIIGAMYLLFGLALLSMCINLLQDEMVAKVKYMINCCGMCCGGTDEDDKDAGVQSDDEEEMVDGTDSNSYNKIESNGEDRKFNKQFENVAYEAD